MTHRASSRKTLATLVSVVAWLAAAARADVEFNSYIRAGGETRFVLTDTATGKRSELLAIGGRFAGVTVAGFDLQAETLTVKDAAGPRSLKMPRSLEAPISLSEAERAPGSDSSVAAKLDEVNARRKERGKPEVTSEEIAQRMEERAAKKPGAAAPTQRAAKLRKGAPDAAVPLEGQPVSETDRMALTRQLRQTQTRLEKLRAATDRPKAQTKTTQVEAEIADLERKLGDLER